MHDAFKDFELSSPQYSLSLRHNLMRVISEILNPWNPPNLDSVGFTQIPQILGFDSTDSVQIPRILRIHKYLVG